MVSAAEDFWRAQWWAQIRKFGVLVQNHLGPGDPLDLIREQKKSEGKPNWVKGDAFHRDLLVLFQTG